MFFKRLSRSRSNSQSYVDTGYPSPHDSKANSTSYDDKYDDRPGSSRQGNQAPQPGDSLDRKETSGGMYARQNQPQEVGGGAYASPPVSAGGPRGGHAVMNGYSSYDTEPRPAKDTAAPDLLMQAFTQALRPYTDKADALEAEISDLRAYIEQLESQRSEVHAWIDKRGLRPGLSLLSQPPNGQQHADFLLQTYHRP